MSESENFPRLISSRLPDGCGGEQVLEFELLEHIGAGGMGTVYRARHLNPPESYVKKHGDKPRIVAVKYLRKNIMQHSDDAVPRFIREAKLLQSLRHPNVVRIYGMGIDQEDVPFIALELVEDAQSLASLRDVYIFRKQILGRDPATHKIIGSLVPLDKLIPILRQMLKALREVHAKGIVHRDIKPENVLLTKDGVVKLTDFGISKNLERVQDPALTMQGRVVGTPAYVSPEAASGCRIDPRTGKAWDVRQWSDIWSVGVLLYELMSGVLPFDADASELPQTGQPRSTQMLLASLILGKIVADHIKPKPLDELLTDSNPIMVALVEACLNKGPWDRPASCDVLLEVLEQAEAYENKREPSPDQQKMYTFSDLNTTKNLGLAPTQLDSVPPERLSRNSGSGPTAGIEVKGTPQAALAPPVKTATEKSIVSIFWIAASFLVAAAICGVLWWKSVDSQSPKPHALASANVVPAPSTALKATSPLQPSAKADKRKPDSGPVPGTKSYTVFQNGVAASHNGDCRRAVSEMRAVLAAFPAFPKPFRILGDCARKSGDLDAARDSYAKYLSFEGVEPLPPEAMMVVNP